MMEGWVDVMYAAADATGQYMQPERNAGELLWATFFCVYILFMFMFILNLGVGVVVTKFLELRAGMSKEQHGVELSTTQVRWLNCMKFLYARPLEDAFDLTNLRRLTSTRLWFYRLISSSRFENFILTCIVLNSMLMCMKVAGCV